ncbi:PilZ domain-containing protein [Desertibacillus haloalkaliphilus]|uniref:PilZ domain-containing protein n=1 Tax=Desertibacillus haloalkaliphilus TaxID=1328930 RepID=UPI001C26DCDF|nr:PilZ domain-containing protein [Desertibacillus haloalkaliphilus]MBU8906284.1 PilZ domain-containing protein [Desertibacillus haloalkaliphilus]
MLYKREETFRYEFQPPLTCTFNIIKINGEEIESNQGQGKIQDISPSGLKLMSMLDLQVTRNEIDVEVYFTMLSDWVVRGRVVWQKVANMNEYYYGIDLSTDIGESEDMINGLKEYIRQEND